MSAGEVVVWCVAIICGSVLAALLLILLIYRSTEKGSSEG